jgi:hypothetical protein
MYESRFASGLLPGPPLHQCTNRASRQDSCPGHHSTTTKTNFDNVDRHNVRNNKVVDALQTSDNAETAL